MTILFYLLFAMLFAIVLTVAVTIAYIEGEKELSNKYDIEERKQ